MKHVQETLKVSERLVCKALCQARASQRYKAKLRDGEAVLVTRIHEMLRRHPLPPPRLSHDLRHAAAGRLGGGG